MEDILLDLLHSEIISYTLQNCDEKAKKVRPN